MNRKIFFILMLLLLFSVTGFSQQTKIPPHLLHDALRLSDAVQTGKITRADLIAEVETGNIEPRILHELNSYMTSLIYSIFRISKTNVQLAHNL